MVVLRALLLLMLLPAPVYAAWYKGVGSAPIINGNEDYAKEQAARAALRDAILQAGASVSLLTEVDEGSLNGNAFQVRANGHVNQIQKLDEYTKDDRVTVTLRADIWNDGALCENQHLTSKSIIMAPLVLVDKQYAVYGGLEDISQEVSQRLFAEFDKAKADFLAKSLMAHPLAVDPDRMSNDDQQQLQYLSEASRTQYIIMGKITDLSMGKVDGSLLSGDKLVREFGLTVYLIDGVSGLPIMTKNYHSRTYWPFSLTDRVAPGSDQLWQSDYGLEVTRILKTAVEDMSDLLKCAHPKSRIIRIGANTLEVAMGGRQGVKVGDMFKLQYQYNYVDEQGVNYANFSDEQVQFEVVKVYPDHSQLVPINNNMPLGIQIRDVVQLDNFWN